MQLPIACHHCAMCIQQWDHLMCLDKALTLFEYSEWMRMSIKRFTSAWNVYSLAPGGGRRIDTPSLPCT